MNSSDTPSQRVERPDAGHGLGITVASAFWLAITLSPYWLPPHPVTLAVPALGIAAGIALMVYRRHQLIVAYRELKA